MGISPIYAIPKVLAQAGLSKEDIDIYEVTLSYLSRKPREANLGAYLDQ